MEIKISDDFDLKKIAESGQCFRPREIASGKYLFITKEHVLQMEKAQKDIYNVSCDEAEWEKIWIPYFDLDIDYKSRRKAIPKEDSFMVSAAELGKGIRILNQDPFEMLISFIISQRKSIPAIRSSVEKICDIYGKDINTDFGKFKSFPDALDIRNKGFDGLSQCSLGYRLPYITEVVNAVNSGEINLEKIKKYSDEDLISYLMNIKGVGIKVASCIALFAYNRGGIAPVDVWINRVIENEYNGVSPFPGYKENSGLYQQYAFYAMKA